MTILPPRFRRCNFGLVLECDCRRAVVADAYLARQSSTERNFADTGGTAALKRVRLPEGATICAWSNVSSTDDVDPRRGEFELVNGSLRYALAKTKGADGALVGVRWRRRVARKEPPCLNSVVGGLTVNAPSR